MLFTTPLFLFYFLPVILAGYFVVRHSLRNAWLLLGSLLFYAWGEPAVVVIMLASVAANGGFGVWVDRARKRGRGKGVVALAVLFNIGLLVLFKYADWLWDGVSWLLLAVDAVDDPLAPLSDQLAPNSWARDAFLDDIGRIRLPIGISFFTFQALSYVIDVYRRNGPVQRNPLNLALYIALFPQLIAGPIVRYCDVAGQIAKRTINLDGLASGVRRFVIGLGKKVLIANVCARAADSIFALPSDQLTPSLAWFATLCYTLQIYFDFSGYSDMAIGLGRMFGFRFAENFRHPYVSTSITDFWRRWHISLSSWFRDYLYMPLGGNRRGRPRTYLNLLIVFFLCGLWHGAALPFLVWGLYHGGFLVIERAGFSAWIGDRSRGLRHAYTLLIVMIGWVVFRTESLAQAGSHLLAMAGMPSGAQLIDLGTTKVSAVSLHPIGMFADNQTWLAVLAGVIGATPWLAQARTWRDRLEARDHYRLCIIVDLSGITALAVTFAAVTLELAAGAYNPFIYFRF